MVSVRFSLKFKTSWGQGIKLIGSHPKMGERAWGRMGLHGVHAAWGRMEAHGVHEVAWPAIMARFRGRHGMAPELTGVQLPKLTPHCSQSWGV